MTAAYFPNVIHIIMGNAYFKSISNKKQMNKGINESINIIN